MNQTAVNLGAGGFVSYFEDGGAAVILDSSMENNQEFSEEPAMLSKVLDRLSQINFFLILQKARKASLYLLMPLLKTTYEVLVAQIQKIEIYTIRKGKRFLKRLRTIITTLLKSCLMVSTVLILWMVQRAINVRVAICRLLKNWKM